MRAFNRSIEKRGSLPSLGASNGQTPVAKCGVEIVSTSRLFLRDLTVSYVDGGPCREETVDAVFAKSLFFPDIHRMLMSKNGAEPYRRVGFCDFFLAIARCGVFNAT